MKWTLILIVTFPNLGGPSITTAPGTYTEARCHAAAEAYERSPNRTGAPRMIRQAICIQAPDAD